ncbi:MAG: MarR family transcriptional regulator [Candidatus Saccharimonadales bacterium]
MEKDLDQLEQVMSQLHRGMSRHKSWEHVAAQAGVNLDRTSAIILQLLAMPEYEHCRLHQIAEKLGIEAPSVTRKAQLLEQVGLLKKSIDKKDARSYHLQPTKKGREVADRLREAKRSTLKTTLKNWSSEDRKAFIGLLQKFADSTAALQVAQQKDIITK